MHRATDIKPYRKPKCLSITMVLFDTALMAAVRFGDFWRSRRGSLSRANVAVIPRLVPPIPTAGTDVSGQRRPASESKGRRFKSCPRFEPTSAAAHPDAEKTILESLLSDQSQRTSTMAEGGTSGRQPVLLSQALVECGFGDETAQETDLARDFSRRIAPPRKGRGRCFQYRFGYDFGRIACFNRLPQDPSHAGTRGVVDVEQSV